MADSSTSSLNVIALISGGKDSFFSLLHCLQNGHKVVALGNLYPPPTAVPTTPTNQGSKDGTEDNGTENEAEEQDLNSFMYQTVGHTVIPLYAHALNIPLYRQEILGTAVQTSRSYDSSASISGSSRTYAERANDETESLLPLLQTIMEEHPEANALSTGAILSTYQRTRIESIALRLGLTPLAYLWQYPLLSPFNQTSLLHDMRDVGLEARIVKVASGGLDETFLWGNVVTEKTIGRLERAMGRFGVEGDGATIGEGGEFETLVVDGPRGLFRGRVWVEEGDLRVVREGGGSAWLKVLKGDVVMKAESEVEEEIVKCRVPSLLEPRFQEVLDGLLKVDEKVLPAPDPRSEPEKHSTGLYKAHLGSEQKDHDHLLFTTNPNTQGLGVEETAHQAIQEIYQHLTQSSLQPTDIIFVLIILRSMSDFAAINKIYGSLFTHPNPPSRVTISCGDLLPKNTNLVIQTRSFNRSKPREALHVQSRSYWAPANIGPYSQATSVSLSSDEEMDSFGTYIAGQIPLVPHTMGLPNATRAGEGGEMEMFKMQAVLALQHLWRIGREMKVGWFSSGVAYLPRCSANNNHKAIQAQAQIASQAWEALHAPTSSEEDLDEGVDLWENKHYSGKANLGTSQLSKPLPNFELIDDSDSSSELGGSEMMPPVFVIEVEELPRGSMIEWHAGTGLNGANGCIKQFHAVNPRYNVHQTLINKITLYTIASIPWSSDPKTRIEMLEEVMSSLGKEVGKVNMVYFDQEAKEVGDWEGWKKKSADGVVVVPCWSIWGTGGRERIGGLVLFERLV